MKKNILLSILSIVLIFCSCSSDNEEEQVKYSLREAKNRVSWTAYKTTDKIPVKGTFTTIEINSKGTGNTLKESIHNTKFSIPISSLKSEVSDYNIINFFFGKMLNTSLLSGKLIIIDDTTGYAEITMNGITEKLHFIYSINKNKFTLSATMNLEKWNIEKAIKSLNEKCRLNHMGSDGIVKLWKDISIEITSTFPQTN